MGMSEFYDPKQNDEESIRVIHRYLDAGGTFLDTADVYGMGKSSTSPSCSRVIPRCSLRASPMPSGTWTKKWRSSS
jgi:predicted aldo/keto reductase-like oxidoreductase